MNETETKNQLDAAIAQLRGERLELIDFGKLIELLEDSSEKLNRYDSQAGELRILKDDYQHRIAGMVKAIAAVKGNEDAMREATELVASLESLGGEQLVKLYRTIRSRFRDHFPFTFSMPGKTGKRIASHTEKYT